MDGWIDGWVVDEWMDRWMDSFKVVNLCSQNLMFAIHIVKAVSNTDTQTTHTYCTAVVRFV